MSEGQFPKESEHLKNTNRIYICRLGLNRSVAAQKMHQSIGEKAEIFPGGTSKLVRMNDKDILSVIGGMRPYLIYDQRHNERQEFIKAEEKLNELGISFNVMDTPSLSILSYQLTGHGIDEFML